MIFTQQDIAAARHYLGLHGDPTPIYYLSHALDALEQARQERDHALTTISNLQQQNTELLEDVAACRQERDTLKAELQAWRDGGLTEEILRKGDGYIKIDRGCLIICAQYFGEKDAEIEALRAKVEELERGEYICKKCGLRKDGEGERGDF